MHCTFVFTLFFTLRCDEVLDRARTANSERKKDAVEKKPNRAGATPLFRLSAAQVNRGVAPALRHR